MISIRRLRRLSIFKTLGGQLLTLLFSTYNRAKCGIILHEVGIIPLKKFH